LASKAVETIFSAVDRITPAFRDMETGADRFSDRAKAAFRSVVPEASRLNDIIKGMTLGNLLSKGITAAVGVVRSQFGNAVSYASDLIEVQNIVNTVFGNSSKIIDDFAKSAGKNFGLTTLQAKKFTSNFGALFSGMGIKGDLALGMSTQLTGLAGDLASFYNLDQTDAFSKIMSGLRGQTQPMLSLGIDVSATSMEEYAKSQGKIWKDIDKSGQMLLRYQYIMERTKLAQGDYQKPIASWAVSSRNATQSIQEMFGKLAEALIPTLIRFADLVSDTAQRISAWADKNKAIIAMKFEQWVNTVFKVVTFLYKVITTIGPAVLTAFVAFKTFSTVTAMINGVNLALQAMGVALTIATGPIGIIAAAIAALAAGLLALNAASKKIHAERMNKYGLTKEELDSSYEIAQRILVERNTAVVEREQILAGLKYKYETGDTSAAMRGAIAKTELWLRENPMLNEDQALEIAAEQVKASRPEEDDPMAETNRILERLLAKSDEEISAINDLQGKDSAKNLRWNKMGAEDFFETLRLGV